MKIAIIGASGFVGRAIVKETLNAKHFVLAISRSGKFDNDPNLVSLHCDIFNETDLYESLKNVDVVISAYNSGWSNPNLYNEFIEGNKHIINVIKKLNKRIIIVGGASSLLLSNNEPLMSQMAPDWKEKVKGAFDLLFMLRKDESFLWTFVSPATEILPLEIHEKYNVGGDYVLYNAKGKSQITVADLAHFIVHRAIHDNNIHKRLTLCNI